MFTPNVLEYFSLMKERENNYPLKEIFSAIRGHHAGQSLRETERFTQFKAEELGETWRQILGASAIVR